MRTCVCTHTHKNSARAPKHARARTHARVHHAPCTHTRIATALQGSREVRAEVARRPARLVQQAARAGTVATQHSSLQHSAACCSEAFHVAAQCNTLQRCNAACPGKRRPRRSDSRSLRLSSPTSATCCGATCRAVRQQCGHWIATVRCCRAARVSSLT
jgi:hypothetical protein